ncbi:MAG: thiamine-phosphate synthase family protein [Fervidicoccaceae archaeon]
MSEMLPHELVSKHVAPEVRGLIAKNLVEKGVGQFRTAKLMGLSQPMINKLLSKPEEDYYEDLENIGLKKEDVRRIVELASSKLYEGKRDEYLSMMSSYFNFILRTGQLCSFHKRISRDVPASCDICMKIFLVESDPIVEEIKAAFELLRSVPNASDIIPEVGSNIVAASFSATAVEEVVGYSGKLVNAGGRVEALGEPVRGGSRHTGSILLLAKRKFPSVSAAFVAKYSRECIEAMKRENYAVFEVGPHSDLISLLKDFESALNRMGTPPDAIADLGGYGIEPVLYIFSSSAVDAVRKALICLSSR